MIPSFWQEERELSALAQEQISEQMRKRALNRSRVLRTLHLHGPMRRTDLSRTCGVRKSSVTSILDELLDIGLVVKEMPKKARSRVALDAARFHVISAWVHVGEIRLARVFLDGRTEEIASFAFDVDAGPPAILNLLTEQVGRMLDGAESDVPGIGVAIPGMVDSAAGIGLYAANLPGWRDVHVREELRSRLEHDVVVESENLCGFWAGLWFGRLLERHQDVVYLLIGDGVGGALFVHERLVRGSHFAAGEFGHVRAGDENRRCGCGRMDCVETYASLPAILHEIHSLCPELSHVRDANAIARAAASQPIVANVLDRSMARLAWVLAVVTTTLDPSLIVLGGKSVAFCERIRPLLEKHLRVELGAMPSGAVEVCVSPIGENAPLQGVAGFVVEEMFKRHVLSAGR